MGLVFSFSFLNCASSSGKISDKDAQSESKKNSKKKFKKNSKVKDEELSKQEIRQEQRSFIAHEFFLRARQQEMDGNAVVALSYYQIAFEYDSSSRDLCFLLLDKLKTVSKLDTAAILMNRCLELKGNPTSAELQSVAEIDLRKGNIAKALEFYNKALDLDGDDKELLFTLSSLYENLKNMPKHIEIMDRLLPLAEYPLRLVEKQALDLRSQGKGDAVVKLYRNAWDRTGDAEFGERLANFYETQELYTSQLDVLRKLVQDHPDILQYQGQKARALILAGETDSALVAYQILNKKNPEEKEFLGPYATLLYEKKQFAEAKDIFKKLSMAQPENPLYHFFLGSIAMETKDSSSANNELKKAIDLNPKVAEYWVKLASFYLQQNEDEKALELIDRMSGQMTESKSSRPDSLGDPYAYYMKGMVLGQVAKKLEIKGAVEGKDGNTGSSDSTGNSGKDGKTVTDSTSWKRAQRFREQGIAALQRAVSLDGNNRRILFELGVALEQVNKRAASIEVMKHLVKVDSSDATVLNYLGYLLIEENKELDYAGSLIEKALNKEPENGAFLDSKGWLYYQKNDFANARKFIQQALKQMPQDAAILEHYALILEKLGQNEAALEQWRQILKIDPDNALAHSKVK